MNKLLPTASQTVGPFLHLGLGWLFIDQLAVPDCPGEHVMLEGRVIDGVGQGVPDAILEIWQADAQGKFAPSEPTRHHNRPRPDFSALAECRPTPMAVTAFSQSSPAPYLIRRADINRLTF